MFITPAFVKFPMLSTCALLLLTISIGYRLFPLLVTGYNMLGIPVMVFVVALLVPDILGINKVTTPPVFT